MVLLMAVLISSFSIPFLELATPSFALSLASFMDPIAASVSKSLVFGLLDKISVERNRLLGGSLYHRE